MRFYAISIVIVWEMGQIAKNKFDSMDIYPRGGGTTDSVTCPGHKFQFGAAVFVHNYYWRLKYRVAINSGLLDLENELHFSDFLEFSGFFLEFGVIFGVLECANFWLFLGSVKY